MGESEGVDGEVLVDGGEEEGERDGVWEGKWGGEVGGRVDENDEWGQ